MDSLNELNDIFLKKDSPLRLLAIKQIAGFTTSPESCATLADSPVIPTLVNILKDANEETATATCSVLVNISASEVGCLNILQAFISHDKLMKGMVNLITNTNESWVDMAAMLLSNLTRTAETLEMVIPQLEPILETVKALEEKFNNVSIRKSNCNFDYIGMVLCNLSQHSTVRSLLLNADYELLIPLLPFSNFADSEVRRQGVVGTIKNCCFNTDSHPWLLKEVEILPSILMPLAGNEEFTDEETEKLPVDLQYLPKTKTREPFWQIRKELLNILNQLCITQEGREFLRESNVYIILRELHKWETHPECLSACENVVDILIRTEQEIGRDNLVAGVEIPKDIQKKFNELDIANSEEF